MSEDFDTGYLIRVEAGDIVDTGSGPPSEVPVATAIWVPEGSVLNGKLVTKSTAA